MQLWLEKVSGIVVSDLFVNNIDLINSFPSLSFDCSKFWNALPASSLIFFFFFYEKSSVYLLHWPICLV